MRPAPWAPTTPHQVLDTLPRPVDPVCVLEVALLAAWRPDTLVGSTSLPGCVLREHVGMTKRANSVLVLPPAVPAGLGAAVDWYARRGLPALAMVRADTPLPGFVVPTPDPQIMIMTVGARRLAQVGREAAGTAEVEAAKAAGVTGVTKTTGATEVMVDGGTPESLGPLVERIRSRAVPGTSPKEARARAVRLLTSAPTQVFCRTPAGGTGRLAVTGVDGVAVIDALYVPPTARRRGEATAMLRTLAGAALAHGARTVALEVEEDNTGAIACYLKAGMRTHHRHRYAVLTTDR